MSTGNDSCADCGAAVGAPHTANCDVARCLYTGQQRLSCNRWHIDIGVARGQAVGAAVCGMDIWTGEWPGDAECREFGWWVQDRCNEGLGFVPCAPDAPGAMTDLNRLDRDARWDHHTGRWHRIS